jgi:predicted YcjX-like family ATPase
MSCICIAMIELNFEEQIENKLEVNSNWKTVTRNAIQLKLAVTFLSEIEILRSTHR